jgi:4-amino-4-deoxy-L-arabinose transferase-like glycosyltransferase
MHVLNRQSLWTLSGVVLLCIIFVAQLLLSVRQQSETFDEPCHMYAGYRSLKYGDFGINPEHPPLVKMVAALPLVHLTDVPEDQKRFFRLDCATGGMGLLSSNGTGRQLFRARSAAAIFALALMIVLFLAVREMFGKGPAFLALVLAVFDPNLLANGALVTTDMAVTCLLLAAVYAFWRYARRPTIARLLICGLAAGLTLAAKHSGLFVLPLLGVLALVHWAMPEKIDDAPNVEGRGRRALRLVGALAAITVIAFAILWSFYGFRYRARPAPLDIAPSLSAYSTPLAKTPINKPLVFLERWHLLPESYLYGLIDVLYVSHGRPTFLLGNWYLTGKWYYFPAALVIKCTLAFMALLLVAVVALVLHQKSAGTEPTQSRVPARRLLVLVLPPLLYLLMSMTSKLNIGFRHVLPMVPFLIAFAAAAAWQLWRRSRAWSVVVALLVAFHVFSSLRSFPDYLPYSNELFGGTAKTYLVLNSSNVDWGQGLKETANYLNDHNDGDCWLAYFGTGVPASYGIHCKPLPGFYNLLVAQYIPTGGCAAKDPEVDGTLIIGTNATTGSFNGPLDLNPYSRFLHETPVANIGGSMLVFRGRYQLPAIAAFCHAIEASRLLDAKQLETQQLEHAGEEARAAVAMAPRDAGMHLLLGDALLKLKQTDAAKAEFESALRLAQGIEPDYQAPLISGINRRLARLAEPHKNEDR